MKPRRPTSKNSILSPNQQKISAYFTKSSSSNHDVTSSKFTQITAKNATAPKHGRSAVTEVSDDVIPTTPGRRVSVPLFQKVKRSSGCLDDCEVIPDTPDKSRPNKIKKREKVGSGVEIGQPTSYPNPLQDNVNFANLLPKAAIRSSPRKLEFSRIPERPESVSTPDENCPLSVGRVAGSDDDVSSDVGNVMPMIERENPFSCTEKKMADSPSPKNDVSVKNSKNDGFSADLPIRKYGRHMVTAFVQSGPGEKELTLTSAFDDVVRVCVLKDFWFETRVRVGDTVNVLAEFNEHGKAVIGGCRNNGLLVVNPDYLVSATTVVSGVFCHRKAVLNEWFRPSSAGTSQMLVGNVIHEFFQEAMQRGLSAPQQLRELMQEIKTRPKNLKEIYRNQDSSGGEALDAQLDRFVKPVGDWIREHCGSRKSDPRVTRIRDIEENVWCPRLGLKGKLDMVVEVESGGGRSVVPLELKTGRPSFSAEHRGQVALYEMMARDRRPETKGQGLLLYVGTGECKEVPSGDNERQHLVMLRNEIAGHVAEPLVLGNGAMTFSTLPEPISNPRACERCEHLTACAMFHRRDGRPRRSFDVLSEATVKHLKDSVAEQEYFFKWCRNVFLEDTCTKDKVLLKDVWCCAAEKRERRGECFSGMVLERTVDGRHQPNIHRFKRCDAHWNKESLTSVGLTALQSVAVSVEKRNLIAICTGTIKDVKDGYIDVVLDRDLYAGNEYADDVFRIDAYVPQNYSVTSLANLARLMTDKPESERLRKIITGDLKSLMRKLRRNIIEQPFFRGFDRNQVGAVLASYATEDYLLIEGMPGCGKTTTIVALIQLLLVKGHSVLLASHTHSAVDNVLLKLKEKDIHDFLRLGKTDKVHPSLAENTDDHLVAGAKSLECVNKIFNSKKLVATTCLGTNHVMFQNRKSFDYCIIDEATQILQPVCLGPLFMSEHFILFGDSKQLPPIVRSKDAKKEGMEESLFLHLLQYGKIKKLHMQFRMNEEIMNLANRYAYEGQLQCNKPDIRNAVLRLPNALPTASKSWLGDVASESMAKSVLLLNTERLSSRGGLEERAGKTYNSGEAVIVLEIVTYLMKSGLRGDQVGVITPFRSQVAHIRRKLTDWQESEGGEYTKVEVNTVDQYQGRDKDVIIISFVRSTKFCPQTWENEILNDKRRINVAITRAKKKLVMIGNKGTIKAYKPLDELLSLLSEEQEIVMPLECLPLDSDKCNRD